MVLLEIGKGFGRHSLDGRKRSYGHVVKLEKEYRLAR